MTEWKHKINIKPYLSDKDDHAAIVAACGGILGQLANLREEFKNDEDLDGIEYDFNVILNDDEAEIAEFNDVLEWLYDWADANRVWLGLK